MGLQARIALGFEELGDVPPQRYGTPTALSAIRAARWPSVRFVCSSRFGSRQPRTGIRKGRLTRCVRGTVEAIERELMTEGFVARYATKQEVDGLPPGEGLFLPCTFWLADNLALLGRYDDARRLFERLLNLRNDVGLLSEEYDPAQRRLLGNFPQAFTHVSLINTASNLAHARGPAKDRQHS